MQTVESIKTRVDLLTAVYPIFAHALPQNELIPITFQRSLRLQNDVDSIRQNLRAIPLVLSNIDSSNDLGQAQSRQFLIALDSVLELLETLVAPDALQIPHDCVTKTDILESHSAIFSSTYPKLATINEKWQRLSSKTSTNLDTDASLAKTLSELAAYIDFLGDGTSTKHSPRAVAIKLRAFRTTTEDLFSDPVDLLVRSQGNTNTLNDDEINFVRKAYSSSSRSQQLFRLLTKDSVCMNIHDARLHLSGFLEDELIFEVFACECEKQQWSRVKYRWNHERPASYRALKHRLCGPFKDTTDASGRPCMAFNDEEVWGDHADESVSDLEQLPTSLQTLRHVLSRSEGSLDISPDEDEFDLEDQKIVEFDLACSLMHLDTSSWLHSGMSMNSVSLLAVSASDRRWKPHIACALPPRDSCEDDDTILSFGLLLMEMEAKRFVQPKDEDREWETNEVSKDSMLKRILVEWKRAVSDGYRHVATACLHFQALHDRTYNSALSHDMRRAATIYRYILAPLYRLVTQQYLHTVNLFEGFPEPSHGLSIVPSHQGRPSLEPHLILFDGITSEDSVGHNEKAKFAVDFLKRVSDFARIVEHVCYSHTIPNWCKWRSEKIRIVVIDTGIDDDDNVIKGARDSGRIKDCCGFVNGFNDPPDPTDYQDRQGHGTHVMKLILDIAPSAEIFVAKVSNATSIKKTELHRIARAIEWAHLDKKVHIISMSFGIESGIRDKEIDKAIHAAHKADITIFAAAANSGGNKPRAYPSNRKSGVICIHASDGNGNDGGISPTPESKKDNFSTLGMAIATKHKGKQMLKSGTSFATPIAVALVANVLELVRHMCHFDEEEQRLLYNADGVCEILRLMAHERQGYDYIMPFHLWNPDETEQDIIKKITKIVRG